MNGDVFHAVESGKAHRMTPILRSTALVALVLLPSAAVAAARPAAHARARTPQLTADPVTVHAGETLTLQGSGFPRDVHVALLAGPPHAEATRIGGANTGRRGRFVATIHIRPSSAAGAFVAQACIDGCRVKATVRFRIVAPLSVDAPDGGPPSKQGAYPLLRGRSTLSGVD